uniref:Ly6/PLAUR domain-containing protein 6-like n=1 Tax=Saccoglossus kowalevskii TaxID=10224 RepID=A0ABM0GQG5_SACKO|nr:PREDICTED: ly6/PLAUR domain-containing protein 6-like [Saccoglossus kowalevskii]
MEIVFRVCLILAAFIVVESLVCWSCGDDVTSDKCQKNYTYAGEYYQEECLHWFYGNNPLCAVIVSEMNGTVVEFNRTCITYEDCYTGCLEHFRENGTRCTHCCEGNLCNTESGTVSASFRTEIVQWLFLLCIVCIMTSH